MKKIICLVVVVLMIAGVAIAAKKMVITAKDLPGLKGTWEGTLGFGIMEQGGTSPVKLEILNDSVPVKARLTISNVPSDVAMQFGDSGGQKVGELDNGKITSQGTIMWVGAAPENFFEVSLKGEKKLGAWYYFRGMRGDGTLKKK
jgi:hypothetical protein